MKALIFDTETTGLIKNRKRPLAHLPEIIEFYGCVVDMKTGEIEDEYDTLIRPNNPEIPEIITKITGLTWNDLKNQKPFAQHWPAIKKLFKKADHVIAHNLNFDKEMVDIELERMNTSLAWPRGICTIEQTMHFAGHRLNLQKLYRHLFDEEFEDAHRAKNDVMALKKVCVELHKQEVI